MSYREEVKEIAREYFTDILYIDDALKPPYIFHSLAATASETAATVIGGGEQSLKRPVVPPKGAIEDSFSVPYPDKTGMFENAYRLVMEFQELGCKASPFYFRSAASVKPAVDLIKRSHLTIIDWNLDDTEGETTIRLLESVLQNNQRMKILVIFTQHPDQAARALSEILHCDINNKESLDQKAYAYSHVEGALIVICNRAKFNASDILETIINLILGKFGYFSLAFFQSINQINMETAAILKQFSQPFEDFLLLQLQSSDLDIKEFSPVIDRMISNHINKVIQVDNNIFNAVLEDWTTVIIEWLSLPEKEFLKMTTLYLDKMINNQNNGSKGKENKKILSELKDIKYAEWVEFLKITLECCVTKKTIACNDVVGKLVGEVNKVRAEKNMASTREFEGINPEAKEKCLTIMQKNSWQDVNNTLGPLVSSIIVHMITDYRQKGDLTESLGELIRLMKLLPYEDTSLAEISNKHGDDAFNNFFHNGDIVYDRTEAKQFLFCISPSCDVFRPTKKIRDQLKFVVGEKLESDAVFQKLKDSEQITILPDPENRSSLVCIKWEYFNTRVIPIIDLKDFLRPYRLEPSYAQQITNNYIAYHSRAGVEELFFKSDHSKRNFFVFGKP